MTHKPFESPINIGATDELSLRVSVATLVRVLFENPKDGEWMLALERKATLWEAENNRIVDVKAQPFGGAIQIHDSQRLRDLIGHFHFDSERSRSERDFRIFIQPSAWQTVREFCLRHFNQTEYPILEGDPMRELVEEFRATLGVSLKPNQIIARPAVILIENTPAPTENVYAKGSLTARIYHIFEARLLDPSLGTAIMNNSENRSNQDLCELALADARTGGPGWANAVLALPWNGLASLYRSVSPDARNRPISFFGHQLDETVAATLEDIPIPKYQRLRDSHAGHS